MKDERMISLLCSSEMKVVKIRLIDEKKKRKKEKNCLLASFQFKFYFKTKYYYWIKCQIKNIGRMAEEVK